MQEYKTWKEYLDSKGTTVEKPIIDPLADTAPKPPKAPERFATKGKGWEDKAALSEKPKDYAGPGTDQGQLLQPKGEKNGKALDSQGDSKLIYEPNTKVTDGKELTSWPKSKTEQFLHYTRQMTLAEFATFVASQSAVEGVNPVEAVRNTVTMANANNNILSSLVREFKRSEGMDRLLDEMFKHQETFTRLATLMADNGDASRRLAKAIREHHVDEITAPPAGAEEIDTGTGNAPVMSTAGNTPAPPQVPARKPVRSIGGPQNPMDLSGGNANVLASAGQVAPKMRN